MVKNNIPEKIKSKSNYQDNITNDYNIVDRIKVRIRNTDRILTMSLMNYLYDYEGGLDVLEYIIYIVQKKKEQGGCDTREHFQCINSGEYFLNIKSVKSSDNNCGISIFTNSLKIKLQPNTLRKTLKIPLYEKLTFQHMEILTSFFHNDISIYKKIENGFNIVFETNMYTDKNKIETYLDNDEHFWLILSHNVKKIMEIVLNAEKKILKLVIINVVMILL